jgi:hypothetical protein
MENIIKMVKENPLPFVIVLCATIPYSLSFIILHYQPVLSLGIYGIIFSGLLFSIIIIVLWWFVGYVTTINFFYRNIVSDRMVEYNEKNMLWKTIITIGSIASFFWSLIVLSLCVFLKLSFKWFILLMALIIFFRLMLVLYEKYYFTKYPERLKEINK